MANFYASHFPIPSLSFQSLTLSYPIFLPLHFQFPVSERIWNTWIIENLLKYMCGNIEHWAGTDYDLSAGQHADLPEDEGKGKCAKNCCNRWSSDKTIARIKQCSFLPHTVYGAHSTRGHGIVISEWIAVMRTYYTTTSGQACVL